MELRHNLGREKHLNRIKSGCFSVYIFTDSQGFEHQCEVMNCKNPNIYEKTGYYLTLQNEYYNEDLFKIPFSSPKKAAIRYFKTFGINNR